MNPIGRIFFHPRGALRSMLILLSLFVFDIYCVEAVTSLYIPGFESQPVSADILGVGPNGRTTWLLHQGKGTTSDHSGFIGSATLVEGPHDVSLTYANSAASFTIGQACSFSEGFAICTIVAEGSTAVQTEFTSHVPIQGGSSITQDSTATAGSNSSSIDELPTPIASGSSRSSPSPPTPTPTAVIPTSSSMSSRKSPSCDLFLGVSIVPLLLCL